MCCFETMTNFKVVSRKSEDKSLHGGKGFERCVCLTQESLFNLPVDSPSLSICCKAYRCINCEDFKQCNDFVDTVEETGR
jgi:hypothetical protein